MYIKSIVLDGFKSYGKRTEIAGFDQLFNAITGLNGSGKSNILDAICFALGLSNMSLARCTTLRELIFKNGQAGVHKAVVTVTFDNTDKSQSPTGYEHLSEIVIRREVHLNSRTKYYVCGQSATNSQVSDLFHSVQLNISNPHFLIMQGRITKVLNMKPHDILAMIEEATGVSMYEAKKKNTQATIEKKELHLRSIDTLINETILPKLDQLRKEQAILLDYQNLVSELEKLSKQYTAWQFTRCQQKADHASEMIEDCNNKIETFNDNIRQLELKQTEIDERINVIEHHNDGGMAAELDEALKEEEKIAFKESSKLEKLTDMLNEEKKNKGDVEKLLAKDEQVKRRKQQEYDNIRKDFDKIEEEYNKANATHEWAKKNYDAVVAGKALIEGSDASASLRDQLIKAEEEYNSSNVGIKITKPRLINCERDLREKRSEATKHKAQYEEDNKHLAGLEENVESIKKRLEAINYDEVKYNSLHEEMNSVRGRLQEVNQYLARSEAYARLKFEYSPIPGFNPKSVYGPVCNLFTLKDSKYARATEKAVGGRLYDIVIDNNQNCKLILDRGNLRRKHNLIALNKVQGRPVDRRSLEDAKKLANDKEVAAIISLNEFEPFLKPAMEYVFGDTLLVPDVRKGMKVTYSHLRKMTVTLDGDIIRPGGDMSGGAVSSGDSFLVTLMNLKLKEKERVQLEARFNEIKEELASMEVLKKQRDSLEAEYNHHLTSLNSVRNRLQITSSHHKLFEEVKSLESQLENLHKELANLQEQAEKSNLKMNELKEKLNSEGQSQKKQMEAAEKALATAKKEVESKKKLIDRRKIAVDELRLELEDLTKSCEQYRENIEKLINVIEEKQVQVDEQGKVVEEARLKVKAISDKLKEQKDKLREQNDEINKLSKKRAKIGDEITEKRLEIKKIQYEIEKINTEAKDALQSVKAMLRKHDWIAEERHLFGKDNSDFPFTRADFNANELSAQVQKLTAAKNNMQRTVNQRANLLLSDKEKESDKLKSRRNLIEQDKDKLIKYMEEVDRKKKDALYKAWQKINVDFDSIFSTFLPNTHAKLDLVPGKDLTYGLEVKVAFGDVWKESLTELSGGQRSLVALSLILALLKYNPAPLYILDEVDAALDQNHTQNTGTMIKKHFNKSQFIIVSLKDDMFRNANVLFKTRFVDGKSAVTRYTHSNAK